MKPDLDIAVLGDVHGHFDRDLDGALLREFPLRLCVGDITPDRGKHRFDRAFEVAKGLASCEVHTILGNHDGPTCFTARRFPKSYLTLEKTLGGFHVGGRKLEFPELGLSLVGGRPLSMGGPELIFPVPGREDWTLERWAVETAELIRHAEQERIVVLAHCGPTGLGTERDAIYGRDFGPRDGDWGDPDLRRALELAGDAGSRVVAVVAGHMHRALRGGGTRRQVLREGDLLHLNAAISPRVSEEGRALHVLKIRGDRAEAELRWAAPEA